MDWYPLTQNILVGILIAVTIYYAIQTYRQASFLAKQLKIMEEQRRKSIQPSLQTDKLSWFFQHLEIEGTDKDALAPGLELRLSNVGYGPALDLSISATCIVGFVSKGRQKTIYRRFYFNFLGYSRDKYLERTTEPAYFRLDLTGIDKSRLEDKDKSIRIKFEFLDVDHSQFSETKSIPMPVDYLLFNIEAFSETDILPCDDNYPLHLLPTCTSQIWE
jgi:hypothetical protein